MGVDRDDYLVFGVDVGNCDWDKHQAELEGAPNRRFDIIYDGMCGEYCIAGKIIKRSDPYNGFEMAQIDDGALGIDREALSRAIGEAFDRPDITPDSLSLLLFSHFS